MLFAHGRFQAVGGSLLWCVQVAILILGSADEIDNRVDALLNFRIWIELEAISARLDYFVDIRVVEDKPGPLGAGIAASGLKIFEWSGRFKLVQLVVEGDLG